MSGVNRVILVGNLGGEPEKFSGGCGFSVATSFKSKDKKHTEWHNISAYGALGETCARYLKKGSKVYIEGRLSTDSFERDGQKHYRTKIVVNQMQMLDSI